MIPIRNKKKSLQVTVEEMRNFAFAYIEKYAPSKQQLKTYLLKKYLKNSIPSVKKQDVTNLIDVVLKTNLFFLVLCELIGCLLQNDTLYLSRHIVPV